MSAAAIIKRERDNLSANVEQQLYAIDGYLGHQITRAIEALDEALSALGKINELSQIETGENR